MDIWNEPIAAEEAAYLGAGFTIKPVFDDHIGALKAIDPKTGEIKWVQKNRAPLWGGALATHGNLVFTGTPEGYLKAFDAKTGAELWKFQTGSGVIGCPITWEMDGEQYVGVVSGWGGAVPLWGGEVAKYVKDLNQGGTFWVSSCSSRRRGTPGATRRVAPGGTRPTERGNHARDALDRGRNRVRDDCRRGVILPVGGSGAGRAGIQEVRAMPYAQSRGH